MEIQFVVVVALLAAAGGAVLGVLLRSVWASQSMKAAAAEGRRIEAEARARQKELILEAKDEKLRLQREAEDEARARRGELAALERRLLQRDEQLDQRSDMLEDRAGKLLERERETDRAREELARAHQEQVDALERVSGLSADDAKGLLLEAVREEAEHDAVKLGRAIERKARDEADEKARDIIITAMQRVAADHPAEHTVSVVLCLAAEPDLLFLGLENQVLLLPASFAHDAGGLLGRSLDRLVCPPAARGEAEADTYGKADQRHKGEGHGFHIHPPIRPWAVGRVGVRSGNPEGRCRPGRSDA